MANPRLRLLLPWRNFSRRDCAIAAFGFTAFIFFLSHLSDSWTSVKSIASLDLVDLKLVRNAKDRGAGIASNLPDVTLFFITTFLWMTSIYDVMCNLCMSGSTVCLDGSAPAYHFRRGFGSGSNNWVLHIEV